MAHSTNIPTRAQSDPATQWRPEHIFTNDEAFLQAADRLADLSKQLASYAGKLSEEGQLLAFLKGCEQASELMSDVGSYANLKSDEDTANARYQGYSSRVTTLSVQLSASLSFFTPELLRMEQQVERELAQGGQIAPYGKYLRDVLRQKKHILPEREEYLLSLSGELAGTPEESFSMLNNADMKFGTIADESGRQVELTHGRYGLFLESVDREVRRSAFETLYRQYDAHSNTLASLLHAHVKKNKFYRTARGYDSCLSMCIDGSNIPEAVYTSLIEAAHGALPAFEKYLALRRRALGLSELHFYDLYVPITENPYERVTYEQAQQLVLEALAPLGEPYCSRIREAYAGGWIDVYENAGKRSGAYSNGNPGAHPYILLNHQDNLDSAFTLAHELGHAMHSDYTNRSQPPLYRNYSIFVAEVASTVNEALLLRHLMGKANDKQLRYLLGHHLEQFRTTFFRQTMFAEFELAIHTLVENGTPLTAELLDETYGALCARYFGEGVVRDPQISKEWSRIPHFYYDFYVYQYATGFAAAQAIADRLLSGDGLADYLAFLSLGDSVFPLEALRKAGVDLTETAPIDAALRLFSAEVDELSAMLR